MYFSINELCHSATATRLGIDNSPSPEAAAALGRLITDVLEPLRRAWGRPIKVNSGYRCPALNAAVGGSPSSQHLLGEAADITAGTTSANKRLFRLAVELGLPFDQLIDEHGYRWIHLSHRRSADRRQILHL